MPLYEYVCQNGHRMTRIRRIASRRLPTVCKCGCRAKLALSAPSVNAWDPSWRFNHMSKFGDGTMTFPNERAYRNHLKKIGADEKALGVREQ